MRYWQFFLSCAFTSALTALVLRTEHASWTDTAVKSGATFGLSVFVLGIVYENWGFLSRKQER